MSKFRKEFIETRDIDCFFKCNNYYLHVSTVGADLPDWINNREKIFHAYRQVERLDNKFETEELFVNREFLTHTLFANMQGKEREEAINNYLPWFINIAKKGFMSFDRTNINDRTDTRYHLVACPKAYGMYDLNVQLMTWSFNYDNFIHYANDRMFSTQIQLLV